MSLVGKQHWSRVKEGRKRGWRQATVAARLIAPQEAGQTLPSHRCHRTDRWTYGYALQVLHREEKSISSLILQERASVLRYLCRCTLGEGLRRFFCVPHSGHVAHRVGFCFPSLHYALLIDMQPLRPVSRRFVSLQKYFSVRKRFTAFTHDI